MKNANTFTTQKGLLDYLFQETSNAIEPTINRSTNRYQGYIFVYKWNNGIVFQGEVLFSEVGLTYTKKIKAVLVGSFPQDVSYHIEQLSFIDDVKYEMVSLWLRPLLLDDVEINILSATPTLSVSVIDPYSAITL